jgi:thiamine-monophosphate kinase
VSSTTLGPGREFDAIRELLERWGERAVAIGDDAAILDVPRGDSLVVSVDSAVENQHFRAGWLTSREIGYRAVSAALSDLAAMAARPLGVLVALAIPEQWRGEVAAIGDGIGEAIAVAGTVIRGGNITASTEMSITTTVLGAAFTPLTRSGVKAGDLLYVSGSLGGPARALSLLENGESPGVYRDRLAHPVPRLPEARWLAERGACAAIDLSDGLVADLRHLAAAASVGITLDAARVPCMNGVDIETALSSGEEYEVIVAASERFDVAAFERRFSLPLTEIGVASAMRPGEVRVIGARVADVSGHDHFSS